MANDPTSQCMVIHLGAQGFVTPFQEWHNERALVRVPERAAQEAELGGRGTATATLVRRERRTDGEFHEELPAPAHKKTCGLGPEQPARICRCRQGDHE
jgi:hypothetical protein